MKRYLVWLEGFALIGLVSSFMWLGLMVDVGWNLTVFLIGISVLSTSALALTIIDRKRGY